MPPITLSILIPVFNEEKLISNVLDRILSAPAPYFEQMNIQSELILVDDGSEDHSCEVIECYIQLHPGSSIQLLRHSRNRGKGAAIRTALARATGEFSIIQDADFEYDPAEYPNLLRTLLSGEADIVFGSRFLSTETPPVRRFWHSAANRLLTGLCNLAAHLNLTDALTCFKAFRTAFAQSIPLTIDKFGIEAELTIKFAKRHARFCEVPISYRPRTETEGKKIRAKDAIGIFGAILRSAIRDDIYVDRAAAMLSAMERAPRFNAWMAAAIKPYLGERVLEIGAGIGNLTALLCAHQALYIVSDVDRHHLAQLRNSMRSQSNVSVIACDLANPADFTCLHQSMDSAVCINVLEHIEDDLLGLHNLHSTLVSGGRAVVLVPQGESVYGTMDETLGHYRRYSKAELELRMKQAGFDVERVIEFNRITFPGWFFNGRILRRRSVSRVQLWFFDLLVPLWRRIDGFLPWPSTSLIAIGMRKNRDVEI